jgi:hypothetical protein
MTLGISPSLQAKMRAQVSELLPDTCVLWSPTSGGVVGGRPTPGSANAGTVSCRVDPIASRNATETDIAMREDTDRMYQLTLPHDTTIAENYKVVHGSVTYEILQFVNSHSWNVSVRAIIQEAQS